MSDDRDLAEAIHREITEPEHVQHALDLWRYAIREHPFWTVRDRVRYILAESSAMAIDQVLARRQREAPTGVPWDGTVELVEPLTGDTKILDKRTGRIVETRRRGEP